MNKLPLPIEEARPPDWLPAAHASADLGLIGYHPPHPGQHEDVLTTSAVQTGLQTSDPVSAPTWGAKDMVIKSLTQDDTLSQLEDLINQVFARRATSSAPIPAHAYRMPSRVTLNDAKRQSWLADLANPSVPLSKLSKSVPHGAKGHDLLELLYTHAVAVPRAVWFLRVLGANEMAGLRARAGAGAGGYDPAGYAVEWAGVVCAYIRRQLADVVLPSAARAGVGVSIKQVFKGALSDPEARARWSSRLSYTLFILRSSYADGLVDRRTFLAWLVSQISSCNLAQACVLAEVADEYVDGIVACRALARPFVDACLSRIADVRAASFGREALTGLERSLRHFIRRACVALPDAFISPRTWLSHSSLITDILSDDPSSALNPTTITDLSPSPSLTAATAALLPDISRRNAALLFRNLPPRALARLTEAVADVTRLNALCASTDLDAFAGTFLGSGCATGVGARVDRLLAWAVTPLQYGAHRPHAAATILQRWRDRVERRGGACNAGAGGGGGGSGDTRARLQDWLFEFLDSYACSEAGVDGSAGGASSALPAVAMLYGELVKRELFSYEMYIQRLIARGEKGLSFHDDYPSRHRDFLRWIPLDRATPAIINQRKSILHGLRTRETPEDANERAIRAEIRPLFPEVFNAGAGESVKEGDARESTGVLLEGCTRLLASPRFEQVKVVKQWLLPILIKYFSGRLDDGVLVHGALRPFCLAIDLLERLLCFRSMFDLCMAVLAQPCTQDFLVILVETLRRHKDIWACMGMLKVLTDGLYAMHQMCKTRSVHSRPLLGFLIEIDGNRYLEPGMRASVDAEIVSFAQALQPIASAPEPVPVHLQEILMLPSDTRPGAASMLANNLWYRFQTSPDWGWRVWDNTFASLRLKPEVAVDIVTAQARTLCYAEFLLQVDQHLPEGLDGHIASWLGGPGIAELVAIDSEAWDCVIFALLYLVVHGAVSATTILQGLVYPLWQFALDPQQTQQQPQSPDVYLYAAHDIFARLLLNTACTSDGIPPTNPVDLQRVLTRRRDAFASPHFPLLIAHMPTLVFLEHSRDVGDELGPLSAKIRQKVCEVAEFRQGVYRDLNAVRDAFESSSKLDSLDEALVEHLMDALRLILNVAKTDAATISSTDWLDTSALLSPWKLAATAIEVQFTLKQMGERLALGTPHVHGNTKVDRLIAKLLRHHMSKEEADFVAEMARGVGPTIVGKFVNTGLRFIANILSGADHADPEFARAMEVVSEQLRLLAHITEPARDAQTQPPTDASTQDEFLGALAKKIEVFEAMMSGSAPVPGWLSRDQLVQYSILLARLLQFDLACRDIWTQTARALSGNLAAVLFRLAMAFGSGEQLCPVAFALVMDTYYYLIDEIAGDAKFTGNDLFQNYPVFNLADLPVDMPAEYREQLRILLPFTQPNETVANLMYASRDLSGHLVHGQAVVNRPWEWVENIGDAPIAESVTDEARRRRRPSVKNTSSIALELFGTRATGEAILLRDDPRIEETLRTFQDSGSGVSMFTRDWIESRTVFDSAGGAARSRGEAEDEAGTLPTSASQEHRTASRRSSPAGSTLSRGSGHMSAPPSRLQSPFSRMSGTTGSDGMDLDHALSRSTSSATRSSKRKASVLSVSGSDIEIVEEPSSSAPAAKRTKAGKAPAKTRGKKR